MNIGIFYGHAKPYNDGAYGIRPEFDLIREYAPLVKKELEQLGHHVIVCSSDVCTSNAESLKSRVNRANSYNLDLIIDCHCNAFNGTAQGCETIYYPGSVKGKKYATQIVTELGKLFANRGAKEDTRGLYVLKHTKAPCVVIEPFFCDSKVDMSKYNPEKVAKAIVKGITGTNYVKPVEPSKIVSKPTLSSSQVNSLNKAKSALNNALNEINAILKEVK